MAAQFKKPITQVPISSSAPIYHLTPDPLFPNPASLFALSSYKPPEGLGKNGPVALREGDPVPPSMLRRSRAIRGGGAFTFVSPLPLEFPYDIQDGPKQVKEVGKETQATAGTIEEALAEFEISPDVVVARDEDGTPTAFSSPVRQSDRFPKPTLLALSNKCLEEWLPQLDIGAEGSKEREQLVEILAGRSVLARPPGNGKPGFAPWSLCYGGMQFGSWASQLGDGRAISLLSTPTTSEVKQSTGYEQLEVQLKGAGRTPYSRFADGLAVLRSSVREFLGAEAVAALRLPTSRALALVGIEDVKVRRERIETAAIVTRVAESWIRCGNFEIQSERQEWDSLRTLTRFVGREVFKLDDTNAPSDSSKRSLGLAVLRETARRNAVTVAGWQAYGFMHGVMNTDNIAVSGACIDYGPYAFMDVFDPHHVCNHSDSEARYSFRNQPTMMMFAITKQAEALAELIGAELDLAQKHDGTGHVEVAQGWGEAGVEAEQMAGWRKTGLESLQEVKDEFVTVFTDEYTRLMRLRLGFETAQQGDFDLVSALLDLLDLHSLDFTNSFRVLSQFPGTSSAHFFAFLDQLLPAASASATLPPSAREEWTKWLARYEERLTLEKSEHADRRMRMNLVNPRFTLRQWVLEETIAKLDNQKGSTEQLLRVLRMVGAPYESYGELEVGKEECELLDQEAMEEKRLCDIGAKELLGFQCSCSS